MAASAFTALLRMISFSRVCSGAAAAGVPGSTPVVAANSASPMACRNAYPPFSPPSTGRWSTGRVRR